MPELPETHTIATLLNKALANKKISKAGVSKEYKTLPSNEVFLKTLTGRKILSVKRIAKNIVFELDNGNFLLFHLAMTGRLLLWENKNIKERWVRVIIYTEDGTILTFSDMRMFGKAAVLGPKQIEALKNRYGPEPLDEKTKVEEIIQKIKSKRTNIKNALLDQNIISGIGNIYANDALFLAKIHPLTKTSDVSTDKISQLFETIKKVLTESIDLGGATLNDKMYVDPLGNEGKYQESFKIYSKSNCPSCGTSVEFIKISGRGTYFCPSCQKYENF